MPRDYYDVLGVDRDRRNLLQLTGKTLGVLVVVFQASHMMLQRIDAGGGEDTRLPHGTAIHSPEPSGPVHHRGIVGQ